MDRRSQINKGHGGKGSAAKKLVVLAKQAGPLGLFAGLGPRMVRLSFTLMAEWGQTCVLTCLSSAPPLLRRS